MNVLNMFGLYYTVNLPTRETETSQTAIIDNCITNLNQNTVKVKCKITALFDHDRQIFNICNLKRNP